MKEPREMPSTSTAVALTKSQVQGRIVFKDVSFAYPAANRAAATRQTASRQRRIQKRTQARCAGATRHRSRAAVEIAKSSNLIARNCVLCDINLDVAAGQVIALVGPSAPARRRSAISSRGSSIHERLNRAGRP